MNVTKQEMKSVCVDEFSLARLIEQCKESNTQYGSFDVQQIEIICKMAFLYRKQVESAGTAGLPSPGTSANSDGGKVVWEGDVHTVPDEYGDIDLYPLESDSWNLLECQSRYHVMVFEPAVTPAQVPVLPTADPSGPLPASTNQEKIPVSQDPEGKEK